MNIKVNKKNGIRLKTKNKLLKDDIVITVDNELIKPEGSIKIKDNKECNVAQYATAQIQSDTLIPENIIEGVDILGVKGVNDSPKYVDLWRNHLIIDSGYTPFYTSQEWAKVFEGFTKLRNYAFAYTNYNYISLPDNITSLGSNVFEHMTKLTSCYLPSNLTEIPDSCFHSCSLLIHIYTRNVPCIAEGVTRVGSFSFFGCWNIRKLILPTTLNTIGSAAFRNVGVNAPNQSSFGIYFKGATPPANLPDGTFLDGVKRVFVPTGSLAAYKEAFVNSGFTGKWYEMDPEDM